MGEKMVVVMRKESGDYVKEAKKAKRMWGDSLVIDVTRDGLMKRFDVSYPVGNVRVPGMEKEKGLSVKSVWEGLKIFKSKKEINKNWWKDEKKIGEVRGCKSYGNLIGIKIGEEIVDIEKGKELFKEIYKEKIEKEFEVTLESLRKEKRNIVLLDYKEEEKEFIDAAEILKEILEEKK